MATLLQSSASRKASTTTSTVTSAVLTASAKALMPAHTHTSGTGVTISNGSIKKPSEPIVNGNHSHERSSIADLSVKTKSVIYDNSITHRHDSSGTTDLSVKIKSTGYDTQTHGYEKPKPIGYDVHHESDVYEKYKKSTTCETSICITEEQKRILHQGTCSLGDALSQVPWMKFRLIAEPNMDCFSSDARLKTFIRQITELTVSIANKQCTDEIAILVAVLVANLKSTMEVRIKLIMETVVQQIASLCLEDSITACQNLEGIKEKVCYPKHHEHSKYGMHCDSDHLPMAAPSTRDSCDDSDEHMRPNGCEC